MQPLACSRFRDSGGKSFSNDSVIRNAKNARGLGRDRASFTIVPIIAKLNKMPL